MNSWEMGWITSSTTIFSTSADAGRENPVRRKAANKARRKYFTKWGCMLWPSDSIVSQIRAGCEYLQGTSVLLLDRGFVSGQRVSALPTQKAESKSAPVSFKRQTPRSEEHTSELQS